MAEYRCDLCRAEGKTLPLLDSYATSDAKDVCEACAVVVNEAVAKSRAIGHRLCVATVRRTMRVLRLRPPRLKSNWLRRVLHSWLGCPCV